MNPDQAALTAEDTDGRSRTAVRRIKTGFNGNVVIMTTVDRPGYLRAAMRADASGFVLEDAPAAIQNLGARNRAEAAGVALRKGRL